MVVMVIGRAGYPKQSIERGKTRLKKAITMNE